MTPETHKKLNQELVSRMTGSHWDNFQTSELRFPLKIPNQGMAEKVLFVRKTNYPQLDPSGFSEIRATYVDETNNEHALDLPK